jgi:hypothetical protein
VGGIINTRLSVPWGRGAVGSASDWQSEGQGFESPRLHLKTGTYTGRTRRLFGPRASGSLVLTWAGFGGSLKKGRTLLLNRAIAPFDTGVR